MEKTQDLEFAANLTSNSKSNENSKELCGIKGLIKKLCNNCGVIYVNKPLNCYARFDSREYACGRRRNLLNTDLKINDNVFLNVIAEPTCCSLYYVTKVWKPSSSKKTINEDSNCISDAYFQYNIPTPKVELLKSSNYCIKKFGCIEILKPHHGFISFEGRNEAVYFTVNDVQDFESPVFDLRGVLFRGQSVRFSAVPNVTNIRWAKWRALEVWSRILEDVSEDPNRLSIQDKYKELDGKIHYLNETYGYIVFERSRHRNFAYFCPEAVKNVIVKSPLEDFLEVGQKVRLTVTATSARNKKIKWNATSVWVKYAECTEDITQNLSTISILQDTSHIKNTKGKLFPSLNTQGLIRVYENISVAIHVCAEIVYIDGKKISNFLSMKSGTDIHADCIQLPEFENRWIALAAWIGEKPQNVGFSTTNLADEIRKVKEIYSLNYEQVDKDIQTVWDSNQMGDVKI